MDDTVVDDDISSGDSSGGVSRGDVGTARVGGELEWLSSGRGVVAASKHVGLWVSTIFSTHDNTHVSDGTVDNVVSEDGLELSGVQLSDSTRDGTAIISTRATWPKTSTHMAESEGAKTVIPTACSKGSRRPAC